ncbi:MAG: single-stranded DNA-binding protein [Candidatus Omnitrophica bacterium]|nr:single-stranded DNA-binding protein [Candidatus Omnitrophota bacterium]MDD5353286.1 single-stranded DNA-binding protein [Candidatus Omnitrophota bacterium]
MLNKATLIGRLAAQPEIKYLQNGDPVCNFNLATSESWKNKEGEKQEKTEWHKIIFFGKLAEICTQYLIKGSLIYLEGKIQTRSWDDKEGVKHYTTEIVGKEMKMLGGKKEGEPTQQADDTPF